MNKFKRFKEFYYWTNDWPDMQPVLQHLTSLGYTIATFKRTLASGYPSAVFTTTATGEIRFTEGRVDETTENLVQLNKSAILALRVEDVVEEDPRIAMLKAELEEERQLRFNATNNLGETHQYNDKLRSENERLKADLNYERRRCKAKCARLDELTSIRGREQEHYLELNKKLNFKDQVIASQKRMIQEWQKAHAKGLNKIHQLETRNAELEEEASHESARRRATCREMNRKLDALETKVVESHKQHKAVLELKDRRIADLKQAVLRFWEDRDMYKAKY